MNIIILAFVFLLILLFKSSILAPFSNPDMSTSLSLGFILIFAFLVGKRARHLKLPQITGFIVAGIICGPYVFKFLGVEDVKNLQLLDGLALSLIALTAGGEMRITRLKRRLKAISLILVFQTIVIITGFVIFCLLVRPLFSLFSEKTLIQVFVFSLLLGVLATATSPSTTIAVITETRARGRYADLILSTAVVKDFIVIILFAFFISWSRFLAQPAQAFDVEFLSDILLEIGGSVLLGIGIGVGIILYLKYIKRDIAIFILGVAFFTYQISQSLGYHPLMICLVAGFLAENFSSQGEKLILAIENSSLPVYVVFFAISGASLNLEALQKSWLLALVLVVLRAVLKFSGTFIGARLAKEDKGIQKQSWAGFISQAGVALGMAIIVERTFPAWGNEFKALVLAIIAINQIIGPVLLQRLLFKAGEAEVAE
jgi:Kef-type K+ transport system membrane component KefB